MVTNINLMPDFLTLYGITYTFRNIVKFFTMQPNTVNVLHEYELEYRVRIFLKVRSTESTGYEGYRTLRVRNSVRGT